MAYNFEKYREKREKVLGVKKRGVSFGTLAAVISMIIILGLGVVVVPKSIAYFGRRKLLRVLDSWLALRMLKQTPPVQGSWLPLTNP